MTFGPPSPDSRSPTSAGINDTEEALIVALVACNREPSRARVPVRLLRRIEQVGQAWLASADGSKTSRRDDRGRS